MNTVTKNEKEIQKWNDLYVQNRTEKTLELLLQEFGKDAWFSTSLGIEDQVLLDLLVKTNLPFTIFTLDTGRLFYETYNLIEKTEKHYNRKIKIYFPNSEQVENLVNEKGINSFYESIENRKECCRVRKLEPLGRALKNAKVWITGLRREQAITRAEMQFAEWDFSHNVLKVNPLIDWTLDEIWNYTKENKVPYNPLHDKNFPSIGCAPCTREILPGEDIRAGRWWWENPTTKECGLHIQNK